MQDDINFYIEKYLVLWKKYKLQRKIMYYVISFLLIPVFVSLAMSGIYLWAFISFIFTPDIDDYFSLVFKKKDFTSSL